MTKLVAFSTENGFLELGVNFSIGKNTRSVDAYTHPRRKVLTRSLLDPQLFLRGHCHAQ